MQSIRWKELIIHPRIQKDFYKNEPRLDAFAKAVDGISVPLCYNGDINTVEDYKRITERFPGVDRIMIGRGLLAAPGLDRGDQGAACPGQEAAYEPFMMRFWRAVFPPLPGRGMWFFI